MKDLPSACRPRERLFSNGSAALSEGELVAILLGTGDTRRSATRLADALLARFADLGDPTGLRGLGQATLLELCEESGMGPAKAARLAAALELGHRASTVPAASRPLLTSPKAAWCLLAPHMANLDREHFMALLLDTKHRLISRELIAIGTLSATMVHPREVFKPALRQSASAVILAHNHPSGDPTPSPEDLALTRQLISAGEILGVRVLDHLVLGHERFTSLRETTDLPFHR